MSYAFISYSTKNKPYTEKLAKHLQDKGFDVWVDWQGIEYGVRWWDAIVEGIKACGAFILVMTPESKASEWVQREVDIAIHLGKPFFPFLLNGKNWEMFLGK